MDTINENHSFLFILNSKSVPKINSYFGEKGKNPFVATVVVTVVQSTEDHRTPLYTYGVFFQCGTVVNTVGHE